MAKRISRRELKAKVKDLNYKLRCKESDLADLRRNYTELRKRFMELGSKAEMFEINGSGIECIEIKPKPWGTYFQVADICALSEEGMKMIKNMLVSEIAKGLLESNNVQIIVGEDRIFHGQTISAKLYVAPWDKLVKVVKMS